MPNIIINKPIHILRHELLWLVRFTNVLFVNVCSLAVKPVFHFTISLAARETFRRWHNFFPFSLIDNWKKWCHCGNISLAASEMVKWKMGLRCKTERWSHWTLKGVKTRYISRWRTKETEPIIIFIIYQTGMKFHAVKTEVIIFLVRTQYSLLPNFGVLLL